MVNLNDISEALQRGKADKVSELIKQALNENITPKEILEEGLIRGMSIIGKKFNNPFTRSTRSCPFENYLKRESY